jgi:hypothetical protein
MIRLNRPVLEKFLNAESELAANWCKRSFSTDCSIALIDFCDADITSALRSKNSFQHDFGHLYNWLSLFKFTRGLCILHVKFMTRTAFGRRESLSKVTNSNIFWCTTAFTSQDCFQGTR